MAEDLIRYDVLAQEALRGLVRKVLTEVAQTGCRASTIFSSPSIRVTPAYASPRGFARNIRAK
jgi:hypothetical protein